MSIKSCSVSHSIDTSTAHVHLLHVVIIIIIIIIIIIMTFITESAY